MFPQRLKYLRTNKGLTQQNMAEFLGITRQGYAKYENGQSEPDNHTLQKIADYYEVSIDYLLGRIDDPTPSNQKQEELDKWGLSKEANVFFKDFESLSDEDKQKAIEHIKFLKHLAEQKNKSDS